MGFGENRNTFAQMANSPLKSPVENALIVAELLDADRNIECRYHSSFPGKGIMQRLQFVSVCRTPMVADHFKLSSLQESFEGFCERYQSSTFSARKGKDSCCFVEVSVF